ncbi:TetR/AcrR family transcriptional regulator [Maridesulfovibrio frigidus]|uniref:TetR/AcrR family transcriptional regulator n=1 Tax=Maridesulfovibrio frigidus TaxID=340956 RepID=UPI0004E1B1DD|nr:TetR/AcrR family transcriptional regulator [Maridesulfovibrio frigidus]
MVRDPIQRRSKEKKRKIIVAGMKRFSEKGFHKTGIAEITEEAGVSVGSFYGYFEDKKDLLIQVAQAYGSSIIRGIYGRISEEAPLSGSSHEIVKHMVDSAIQAHTLSTELHREMLALKNREPEMAKLDKSITDSFQTGVEAILENCGDRIKVKDIEIASKLVTRTIEETMHSCFLEHSDVPNDKIFDELVEMCTGYLFKSTDRNEMKIQNG